MHTNADEEHVQQHKTKIMKLHYISTAVKSEGDSAAATHSTKREINQSIANHNNLSKTNAMKATDNTLIDGHE